MKKKRTSNKISSNAVTTSMNSTDTLYMDSNGDIRLKTSINGRDEDLLIQGSQTLNSYGNTLNGNYINWKDLYIDSGVNNHQEPIQLDELSTHKARIAELEDEIDELKKILVDKLGIDKQSFKPRYARNPNGDYYVE